jgi:hypothetical protein
MKNRAMTWMAGGIAIGLLMSGAARAQAPRTQDGRPDLSGIWRSASDRHLGNLAAGGVQVLLEPGAATLYKERQASKGKGNPADRCLPRGIPGAMLVRDRPWKVVQTPGTVIMLFDELLHYRQIFTDGRGFPPDSIPTWFGYSVGKWDGDALIVDTIGFNEETWLDDGGHPHSEALRVTERFRRLNAAMLDIDITINDPKAYTKPWTATVRFERVSEADFGEHICGVKSVS